MAMKRIGLFGNFGSGNLGNEGTLEAVLLFLRQAYPNADMFCICKNPDAVREHFGIPGAAIFSPRLKNGGLAKIQNRIADHFGVFGNVRDLDLLVIPGTGILDDFGERPIGFPYALFLVCLMARLRGIKIAFVSIGAGPIRHPLSRWLMKSAARMAFFRSYRDLISKEFMESIGFDTSKDAVYPDLAFGLPDAVSPERKPDNALTVGLGVMAYYGWTGDAGNDAIYRRYIEKLSAFAIWLLDNGHRIRLLVGEDIDQHAVGDLLSLIRRKSAHNVDAIITERPAMLRDVMDQIAQVDVVVATRFHNVLCALKGGKPTISLGYARKNDVLMAGFGLEAFCQHVEQFDLDILKRQFTDLVGGLNDYQSTVKENLAVLKSQLKQQEQYLISNVF
jgi:polysaccharide pyruvyl transferase WcaK-like protein